MRTRLLSLFVTTAFLSTPFVASALVIDDFADDSLTQIAIVADPSNPQQDADTVATLLGNREIFLERTAGFGSASADANLTAEGYFSLATGPGVVASAALTYSGFGNVDVTDMGTANFLSFTARSDLDAVVTVSFLTAGAMSSATVNIPGLGAGTEQFVNIPLGAFLGGANLANVDAISVLVSGPSGPASLDMQISRLGTVQTPIPEPGTLALLGIGLAGLAHSSRRRA